MLFRKRGVEHGMPNGQKALRESVEEAWQGAPQANTLFVVARALFRDHLALLDKGVIRDGWPSLRNQTL
jgi:hypothetical protein